MLLPPLSLSLWVMHPLPSALSQWCAPSSLQVRVPGAQRERDADGGEFTVYLVDSVLMVHGVQTTLRSVRCCRIRSSNLP